MSLQKKNIKFIIILLVSIAALFGAAIFERYAKARNDAKLYSKQIFIDYHYISSFVDLYSGDINSAIFNYKQVLPYLKHNKFYNEYANMLIYSKDYDEAERFLQKAVKKFPDNKNLYIKLVNVLIIKNDTKKALTIVDEKKKIFKDSVNMYEKIAILYIRNAKYKKALEYLQKILKYNKNNASIYYYAALCYANIEDFDKAIEYVKSALNLDRSSIKYKLLLSSLYEKVGKYKKAIDIYASIDLKNGMILSAIGNDYYMLKDMKNALKYFNEAYRESSNIDYAEKVAYMLIKMEKYNKAIGFIEKNKLESVSDRMEFFYATALIQKRMYKKAIDILTNIKPSSNFYKDALYNKSLCYYKLNKTDKAIQILESIKKKDEDIYYMIANLYSKNGQYKKAAEEITNNIDNFKDKSKAYFYTADICYDKLKDTDLAVRYLKMAIKLNPDDASALNYLGYLYIDEGIDINKGIKLVKEAIKLYPNNSYYIDSLGWGYYKKGQYRKAAAFLEKAIAKEKEDKIKEENFVIEIHLAKTYIKLNKKKSAEKILRGILKKSPKNREAIELLNSIK